MNKTLYKECKQFSYSVIHLVQRLNYSLKLVLASALVGIATSGCKLNNRCPYFSYTNDIIIIKLHKRIAEKRD